MGRTASLASTSRSMTASATSSSSVPTARPTRSAQGCYTSEMRRTVCLERRLGQQAKKPERRGGELHGAVGSGGDQQPVVVDNRPRPRIGRHPRSRWPRGTPRRRWCAAGRRAAPPGPSRTWHRRSPRPASPRPGSGPRARRASPRGRRPTARRSPACCQAQASPGPTRAGEVCACSLRSCGRSLSSCSSRWW